MLSFLIDWLNMLLRWGHMIAGIAWIGTSFYFIALDLSLRRREKMRDGVMGTAWEVHGGGFYHVEKFTVAPAGLPDDLIWFKWEAYLTWVTGFLLLVTQFYLDAATWMIDPAVMTLQPWQAILLSMISLLVGWVIYDLLCRSALATHPAALAATVYALILFAAWFYGLVFSGRAALIHMGAFMGTIMAANVFAVIIPNQKKIIAALMAGQQPDVRLGAVGKQRSTHNTYLTLPVLVMMISGHYPMLTGHPQAWLLVGLIVAGGAGLRIFLLGVELGGSLRRHAWTLPVILGCLGAAMWLTRPADLRDMAVSDEEARAIVVQHCSSCHATHPRHESFDAPPKAVVLETLDDLRRHGAAVMKFAVRTDTMPLGNETGMTPAERQQLGAWLQEQGGD